MLNRLLCVLLVVALGGTTVWAEPVRSETEDLVVTRLEALLDSLLNVFEEARELLPLCANPEPEDPEPDPEIGVVIEPHG